MKPSKNCLDLIKKSEGLRLKAYKDGGGVLTIGYGHTGKDVKAGMSITADVAAVLLNQDVRDSVQCVNKYALPCTQGQFDALVDFVFNLGSGQFLGSHLYRYHKAGQHELAKGEFKKWCHDNGKVVPGLVIRRAAEAALYGS